MAMMFEKHGGNGYVATKIGRYPKWKNEGNKMKEEKIEKKREIKKRERKKRRK